MSSLPAPQGAVDLPAPAVALATTSSSVLVLDALGEKVFRYGFVGDSLVLTETVFLPERIFPARCLAADPFFFYVSTGNMVSRFRRTSSRLDTLWTTSGEPASGDFGLTPFDEIVISDTPHDRVLVLDTGRRARAEIGRGTLLRPRGLAVGPEGRIAVINSSRCRLSVFSRIGGLLEERPLPSCRVGKLAFVPGGFVLAADQDMSCYVVQGGSTRRFQGDFRLTDLGVTEGRLLVLDRGERILSFPLPGF